MKNKQDNSIIQLNDYLKQYVIIARNVDVHYCIEICSHLQSIHPNFRYTYYKTKYLQNNKDILDQIFFLKQ